MASKLNDSVRLELRRTVQARFTTFAEASRRLEMTQTWLGRRLNGGTELTLNDLELICSRLDIPLSDVLKTEDETAS
jgi:hypothetical protein